MPRRFLLVAAFVVMFLRATGQSKAGTLQARSPALADIKSAILSAHDGDTVIVPPGEARWASPLVITKSIILEGATNIAGALNSPAITDNTVILDDRPRGNRQHSLPMQGESLRKQRGWGNAGSGPSQEHGFHERAPGLVVARLKPSQSFRLSGFTFRYGSDTTIADKAVLYIDGTCPSVRVDHCHFDQLYANPFIMIRGQIYGVVDHCVLDERPRALTFQVFHDGWGGHTHGDGSWADDTFFGSEKFLFIEDNTFRNANGYKSNGVDSYGGGR